MSISLDSGTAPTFSAYIHVPYCARRCGYCDFNTYTATELGPGVTRASYPDDFARELELCGDYLAYLDQLREGSGGGEGSREGGVPRQVDTVFFGGGTPSLLGAKALGAMLKRLSSRFPLAVGAEITTEANPDSLDAAGIYQLAEAGFTRVSFGMQSVVDTVLQTLDRTHSQAHLQAGVRAARAAGLQVSVDLIYGAPGESMDDWRRSLEAALSLGVEHVSAYALVIEPGTKMGALLQRGKIAPVNMDEQADKYEMADRVLSEAGLKWYEISNWAYPGRECRHNLAYWGAGTWWGFGPGAHSYYGGRRWWNVKHPRAYAQALTAGRLPIDGFEDLGPSELREEQVMLGLRLREGLDLRLGFDPAVVAALMAEHLIDPGAALRAGRAVLTLRGRLLADQVTARLLNF